MPTVVYASILIARAVDRVLRESNARFGLAWIVLGMLIVLAASARLVAISAINRADARDQLRFVLADPIVSNTPPESRFFVSFPQFNRMYGRTGLAYDHWLYSSFEATGSAEPRQDWLSAALRGPIRVVVDSSEPPSDPGVVPGVKETLPQLGFHLIQQYGKFAVWHRPER
jgi:hypothetical protein